MADETLIEYFNSIDEALALIKQHELQHTVRFSVVESTPNFGKKDITEKNHKFYWDGTNTPYMVLGKKYLDCHHGIDRQKKKKDKLKKQKNDAKENDHNFKARKYTCVQETKKFGCPAQIEIREIVQFPEYKGMDKDTCYRKRLKVTELKASLKSKSLVQERKYIVKIPPVTEHKLHSVGEVLHSVGEVHSVGEIVTEHKLHSVGESTAFLVEEKQEIENNFTVLFSANLGFLFPELECLPEKYIASQKVGFAGVECGDVYNYPLEILQNVQKETGLQQVLLNAYSGDKNGVAAVPGQEQEFQEYLEISIQFCAVLNCRRLHIMAGQFPDSAEITEEMRESFNNTYMNNLRYASERLAKENITVLIEPISTIPDYFLTRTDQALDILDKLACSNIKLQLDLYHHQRTHGNIAETLNNYLNFIGHIQVAQVPGRHQPDGNGEINYKFIFEYLGKIGYEGWVGCEYIPSQSVEAFQWLESYRNI